MRERWRLEQELRDESVPPPQRAPPPEQLLALQQSAGNHAVAGLVQRFYEDRGAGQTPVWHTGTADRRRWRKTGQKYYPYWFSKLGEYDLYARKPPKAKFVDAPEAPEHEVFVDAPHGLHDPAEPRRAATGGSRSRRHPRAPSRDQRPRRRGSRHPPAVRPTVQRGRGTGSAAGGHDRQQPRLSLAT